MAAMKTLSRSVHGSGSKRPAARPAAPGSKWALSGPARRFTREELIAQDAAYLARIGAAPRSTTDAVQLVRSGRHSADHTSQCR